jgi:hypothetical protein
MPIKFNVKTKIVVNGKEYASVDELPPELRKPYEQALARNAAQSKITFNGQSFNSVEEMPEDVRRMYKGVMSAMDKDHDGIPDVLQSGTGTSIPQDQPTFSVTSQPSQGSVIEPDRLNQRLLLISFLVLGILAIAGIVLAIGMSLR